MYEDNETPEITAAIDVKPFALALITPEGAVMTMPWHPGVEAAGRERHKAIVAQGSRLVELRRLVTDSPDLPGLAVRELFATSLPLEGNVLEDDQHFALARFAWGLGYARMWSDSPAFFELPGEVDPLATASAHCEACGSDYREQSFSFWAFVNRIGLFPSCPSCRASMAWTVVGYDPEEHAAGLAALEEIIFEGWALPGEVEPHEFPLAVAGTEELELGQCNDDGEETLDDNHS